MNSKTKLQEKNKMCEIDDHIFKYFEIKRRLGKGAYGIVWKALHRKTNQTVAVKKIFDAFRDETDAQRTFREIMFLRAFRDHPCIIQLHNVYKASNNLDIYLSFEFMESDLHNVIKKGNVLKDVHKRFIFYQLLNAISYIHSGNVIHRDLKPSNILIDTKCNCKLADFGLARSVSNQQMRDAIDANESLQPLLTDYVATRWYRAPEILVASKRYTKGIDMWSLGCILGEMIRGKPIFQGNSTVDQIEKIISALPEVTEKDIISVGAGFGSALLNKTISGKSTTTLDELLIDGTGDANDLVKRLLVLDPMARLTAIEALGHKYVERFQDRIELIELNADVKPPFHDDIRLSVNEYRSKLYEIIQQTEKSSSNGKTYSFNRKSREPRANNKSSEIIPSNLNAYNEKLKQNAYRSQERKPCITTISNDVTSLPKVAVMKPSNKVKLISSPPHTIVANNRIHAQNQVVTNLIANNGQPDSKTETVLTKSKYTMKSSVKHVQSSTAKNISSSPELVGIQKFNSKSNRPMMEKRHSIDGSYNYVQPVSRLVFQGNQSSGSEKFIPPTLPSHNNHHHLTNRYREKTKLSSSGFRKSYQNINSHNNINSVSPSYKKPVPSTTTTEELTILNDGSNYYEKRLKRLEEQIEKHKRDVKAFCSENSKHSRIIQSNNKRQSESTVEQKITYKDNKYYINPNGKSLQFRPKADCNSSGKYYAKQSSSEDFDYIFSSDSVTNHRQALISKYGEKIPSKIT